MSLVSSSCPLITKVLVTCKYSKSHPANLTRQIYTFAFLVGFSLQKCVYVFLSRKQCNFDKRAFLGVGLTLTLNNKTLKKCIVMLQEIIAQGCVI